MATSTETLAAVPGTLAHIRVDSARDVDNARDMARPTINRMRLGDIRTALKKGMSDFVALRSDVIALCVLYPFIGLVLAWVALKSELWHLLFPLMAGFVLMGPVAAVGLYEMSKRREQGHSPSWMAAVNVLRSRQFGTIFMLGLLHTAIFIAWMLAAHVVYSVTLGPTAPVSLNSFVDRIVTTPAGWGMVLGGLAVGGAFAALVLAMSVVSFPLLLDRAGKEGVGVVLAVTTSLRVARKNPDVIGAWGVIVAFLLAVGSLPMLLGLVVVVPVLGHATWHLYRCAVDWDEPS